MSDLDFSDPESRPHYGDTDTTPRDPLDLDEKRELGDARLAYRVLRPQFQGDSTLIFAIEQSHLETIREKFAALRALHGGVSELEFARLTRGR